MTLIGGGDVADVWQMNGFQTTGPMTNAIQRGSAQGPQVSGRVQIPARRRDRIPGFHEDSINSAVIACVTVRDRQEPKTHQ